MITALNKQTNEALGFPDGMSSDAIDSAIHSDKMGRPDVDVNPNSYDTVIRPALKDSMAKNDPNILYNARIKQLQVDPFLSTLFNPFGLAKSSDPNIKEEQKLNVQAHPDEAMVGSLAQQLVAISAVAAVTGPAVAPLAARLGLLARGATPMAIRTAVIGSGEVLPKIAGDAIEGVVKSAASAGMVGALYQGISSSVEQGKGMIDNNKYPDLLKIGTSMAQGLGWAVYGSGGAFTGNLMGISAASATVGGTAYLMSKADGSSESDARLNGIVMTAFTAVTHGNFTFEARKKLVSDLQDTFAGYTKAKNPDTEQNNIHKLVGDELVGSAAKSVLTDKLNKQLEDGAEQLSKINKFKIINEINMTKKNINFIKEDLPNLQMGEAHDAQSNIEDLESNLVNLARKLREQLQSLENEGGSYAINQVVKENSDTEELVKRLADQTFGTSKIGKSIEQKAKDAGTKEGFDKTAQYRPTTFEEQEKLASKEIKDIDSARAIIRGEKPLPKDLEGVALIAEMEKHLKEHPDAEIAYELANSPLVTETSEQARGLSVARMREQDSFAQKIAELKSKKLQMSKEVAKDLPKRAREEMNKVNLSKEDLNLDKFLDEIKC